jgi:hypothetical protein
MGKTEFFEGNDPRSQSVSVNSPQARSSLRSMMWIIVM